MMLALEVFDSPPAQLRSVHALSHARRNVHFSRFVPMADNRPLQAEYEACYLVILTASAI